MITLDGCLCQPDPDTTLSYLLGGKQPKRSWDPERGAHQTLIWGVEMGVEAVSFVFELVSVSFEVLLTAQGLRWR